MKKSGVETRRRRYLIDGKLGSLAIVLDFPLQYKLYRAIVNNEDVSFASKGFSPPTWELRNDISLSSYN